VTSRLPTGAWLAALSGRIRPAQLRTRVLAGVLAVTLATLAAVGFAGVHARPKRTACLGREAGRTGDGPPDAGKGRGAGR